MDSSKVPEGDEECSSSESGWTMYIASPDNEHDRADDEDDDEDIGVSGHGGKKDDEDADSDDSMASDASSGPSVQKKHLYGDRGGGFGHAGTRDEIKCDGEEKFNQQEEKKKHHEKIKAATDKSTHRANSGSRSKKM